MPRLSAEGSIVTILRNDLSVLSCAGKLPLNVDKVKLAMQVELF